MRNSVRREWRSAVPCSLFPQGVFMRHQIVPGVSINACADGAHGVDLSRRRHRPLPGPLPLAGQRKHAQRGGKEIGSALIGQNFTKPEYFHPRPSAAGNDGYDATASTGSNYGPTNQKLIDRVKSSVEQFRKENPDYTGPIPADLLTASASGLDPGNQPRLRRSAGATSGQGARHRSSPGGGAHQPEYEGRRFGFPG